MTRPTSLVAVDDYVFLLGRPPIGEFLGFIRSMAIDGQSSDQGVLTQEWRTANDHLRTMEISESEISNNPPIEPLPAQLQPLAQRVMSTPVFQQTFCFVPTDIAIVELDRLVVFQKFINLDFVQDLKSSLPGTPSSDDVARMAFGLDRTLPPPRIAQTAPNTYSFISPSTDFRFLENRIVGPQQVTGFTSTGFPVGYIVLGIGFGSNYLNALHVDGRLILNNGSHRAYALRDIGITHVPCVIQRVTRKEELELVSTGDFQQNPDRYIKDRRPPLLKDYFDSNLRKVVPVPRKHRHVRIQFGVEISDVPAT